MVERQTQVAERRSSPFRLSLTIVATKRCAKDNGAEVTCIDFTLKELEAILKGIQNKIVHLHRLMYTAATFEGFGKKMTETE